MEKNKVSVRKKRIIVLSGLAVFIILSVIVGIYIGKPMIKFIDDHEKFRAWVDSNGIMAMAAFMGMMVLQVIIALIPGEPLELAAGYAFGPWIGTLLCLVGALIGSIIVFLIVRKFGMKAVTLFFDEEKINKLKFLHNSSQRNFLIFIIFFIPGTPKDLLAYFVGLTDMKISMWIAITAVARIPSIITSTVAADAIGMHNYLFAGVVFGGTLLVSLLGIFIYNRIIKKNNAKGENTEKNT